MVRPAVRVLSAADSWSEGTAEAEGGNGANVVVMRSISRLAIDG
jgi:hypothetical protein